MTEQTQLLVFCLADRLFALHLIQVQRVIRAVDATPLSGAPEIVLGVINLHGAIIPLMDTHKRFGFGHHGIRPENQFIIASTRQRTVALNVDSVKEIVQRPSADIIAAGKILRPLERIEGVIQFEDGLVLVHDLDRFLSLDEGQMLENALKERLEP